MLRKVKKYLKFAVCCTLIMSLVAPSYAALSASDGSAFVTKAEFDSALADFNARLTTFEAGINSKIDSQVTSYLDRNGIWNGKDAILEDFSWYGFDHADTGSAAGTASTSTYILYDHFPMTIGTGGATPPRFRVSEYVNNIYDPRYFGSAATDAYYIQKIGVQPAFKANKSGLAYFTFTLSALTWQYVAAGNAASLMPVTWTGYGPCLFLVQSDQIGSPYYIGREFSAALLLTHTANANRMWDSTTSQFSNPQRSSSAKFTAYKARDFVNGIHEAKDFYYDRCTGTKYKLEEVQSSSGTTVYDSQMNMTNTMVKMMGFVRKDQVYSLLASCGTDDTHFVFPSNFTIFPAKYSSSLGRRPSCTIY